MIYIENLCEYLRLCIRDRYSGILFPQNLEYVSTRAIVDCVTKYTGHRPHYTAVFNPLLRFLSPHVPSILKVFGSKVYDKTLSPDIEAYNKYSFEESMERYFGLSKNERGKVFGDRL
jgi:UDP-glucose 4-epimerase